MVNIKTVVIILKMLGKFNLQLMCLVNTDSYKRIHPIQAKFKYQKLDQQKLTGKKILRKRVCAL